MNIVDRLKRYMDYIGMASTQFADVANIPRPTISQILNGRNRKISNEVIEKLHVGFPNLNMMWLLFGDGDMEVRSNYRTSDAIPHASAFTPPTQSSNMSSPAPSMQNPRANTPLQSTSIDDFVQDTIRQRNINEESISTPRTSAMATSKTNEKTIRYIMVFFNDNSFEVLTPA